MFHVVESRESFIHEPSFTLFFFSKYQTKAEGGGEKGEEKRNLIPFVSHVSFQTFLGEKE